MLATAFLINCAFGNFMSKHGFYFETNCHNVSQSQVEIAADLLAIIVSRSSLGITEQEVLDIYDKSNYVVQVRTQAIDCPNKENSKRKCQGLHQHTKRKIQYVHHPRLSDSSYVHELLHLILYHVKGDADGGHTDLRIWERACRKRFAKDEARKTTCEMRCIEGLTNSMIRGLEDE